MEKFWYRWKVFSMKKELRVKKNKEFQEAFQKGQSFANRQFVVYSLKKAGSGLFSNWSICEQEDWKCCN